MEYAPFELDHTDPRSRSSTWPLQDPNQPPPPAVVADSPDMAAVVKTERQDSESPLPHTPKSEPKKMRNAWGNLSYAELITQAILSSPDKRLTLSEIYDWIVQNVPYFADKANSPSTAGWKVKTPCSLLHPSIMGICMVIPRLFTSFGVDTAYDLPGVRMCDCVWALRWLSRCVVGVPLPSRFSACIS